MVLVWYFVLSWEESLGFKRILQSCLVWTPVGVLFGRPETFKRSFGPIIPYLNPYSWTHSTISSSRIEFSSTILFLVYRCYKILYQCWLRMSVTSLVGDKTSLWPIFSLNFLWKILAPQGLYGESFLAVVFKPIWFSGWFYDIGISTVQYGKVYTVVQAKVVSSWRWMCHILWLMQAAYNVMWEGIGKRVGSRKLNWIKAEKYQMRYNQSRQAAGLGLL